MMCGSVILVTVVEGQNTPFIHYLSNTNNFIIYLYITIGLDGLRAKPAIPVLRFKYVKRLAQTASKPIKEIKLVLYCNLV